MPRRTFILILWMMLVLPACNFFDAAFLSSPLDEQAVISFTGANLPDGATDVYTSGEAALDTMVILRFDAPTESVAGYVGSLGLDEAELAEGYSPFLSNSAPYAVEWWDVNIDGLALADYGGLHGQRGGKFYNLLVIYGGEISTIYLQVFNT